MGSETGTALLCRAVSNLIECSEEKLYNLIVCRKTGFELYGTLAQLVEQ